MYRIACDQLYTNDKEAKLVYVHDVDEAYWPAHFQKVVGFAFADAVAISLTDNNTRADMMYNLASDQRVRSRAIDSQQTPPYVHDLMRVYLRRSQNPLSSA